ncbi:MAG: alpha-mannosidase, partial [Paenibacillaceae bacterium]|nr:alpha-mannosidase [Paenibacillaceae bacterium]
AKIEQAYLDRNVSEHALMLFGIGDGGGGPGEEHLERLEREHNLLGLPPVVQEPSLAFFERLEQEASRFQTYRGELYLEKHQGTLTTQARNKWYNRKLEKALRELEFAASLQLALGESPAAYPTARLEEIWKEMLLYQFHDILPGSSITRVYDESLERYAKLLEEVRAMTAEAYGRAAGRSGVAADETVLFNSLPWERREWVEMDGSWQYVQVPAMGWRELKQASAEILAPEKVLIAEELRLENERLEVRFAEDGSIVSLYDKAADRETVQPGERANVFTIYHDDGDAWDFPRDYRDMIAGTMTLESRRAYVSGPQAIVEQVYRFGESTLKQTIRLLQGEDLLRFETEADWQEKGKMLRVAFPVAVVSDQVNCEIQFGVLKRPTTRNNAIEFARDEICAHHYLDLSQPDYGVALLNDSKYGHRAEGGVLDLNLLRSPGYPDPQADRAEHRFTYAVYPHAGDFIQAGVYRKGYELNIPLTLAEAIPTTAQADGAADNHTQQSLPLVIFDHPHVMVEAVKKAEDSNHLIFRLYETAGAGADGELSFGPACRTIEETNLLEELTSLLAEDTNQIRLQFTPFEIKTIRVQLA